MNPQELKKSWTAKWRRLLDDHDSRMDNPEAYRVMCRWESREMLEAGVIDQMEKLEMDEMVDAAYWHAVEELVVPREKFLSGAHYDVVSKVDRRLIGQVISSTYYTELNRNTANFDGKILTEAKKQRLVFRHGHTSWVLDGLVLTSKTGELYDLVQTTHFINGRLYPCVDDPDSYRLLVDSAQLALERHDFDTYRIVRPLLLSARFTKCGLCMDNFAMREDCDTCTGNGFVRKQRCHPSSSA